MEDKALVSVICMAYNHGESIRKCLEGFVSQKTDFKYEIIIHDDASTDGTPDIIREFCEKYPELIKPIFQKENQYSKGVQIVRQFMYPLAEGEYCAYCEGDDYWIDEGKLQKQIDALRQHPECDICATASYVYINGKRKRVVSPSCNDTVLPAGDVIRGGGGFVCSNTLVYRKEMDQNPMRFSAESEVDYFQQINGAIKGGMVFLQDVTGVYNLESAGSWSAAVRNDSSKKLKWNDEIIRMLNVLDEETEARYHSSVEYMIKKIEFSNHRLRGEYKQIMGEDYKIYRNEMKPKQKLKLYLKYFATVLGGKAD